MDIAEAGDDACKLTVIALSTPVIPVIPEMLCGDVYARMTEDAALFSLPIVSDGRVVGLAHRISLMSQFARPYWREVYSQRPITKLMDPAPLLAEAMEPLESVGHRIATEKPTALYTGFVITQSGNYFGVGSGTDLLRKIATQAQLQALALRQTKDHLARAQSVAHLGSVDRDLRTGALIWSDQMYQLYGVDKASFVPTVEQVLGLHVQRDGFHAVRAPEDCRNGEQLPQQEYRIARPDGTERVLQRDVEIFYDENGMPTRFIAAVRDVTEERANEHKRTELEDRLRHSQRLDAIGTLAGGIAHEVNNALVPVILFSKALVGKSAPGSREREMLQMIADGGERARTLISRILAFSREQESCKKPTRLDILVSESLSLLRATTPTTIDVELAAPPVPEALIDPVQIHQVVVNLAVNAIHAIGDRRGKLRIEVCPPASDADTFVRLSVIDNGCGMDGATKARVFQPFFTTKPVGVGTGLGLSVVHGIVTDHGGRIECSSALGEGTRFDVFLPIARKDATTQEAA